MGRPDGRPMAGGVGVAGDTGIVGMNPFRPHRRSPADLVMVVAAIAVCVALVIWALIG